MFGIKNLAITAGVEVDKASDLWTGLIDQNRDSLHKIIVPSEFTKDVLFKDVKRFNKNNADVLFEGVDTTVFKPLPDEAEFTDKVAKISDQIKEPFAFLFTGQWVNINEYMDMDGRKNIKGLITMFYKTFTGMQNDVSLVLKTNAGNNSVMDKTKITDLLFKIKMHAAMEMKIDHKQLPNIHLIHGNLTDEEVNQLYNIPQIKAMVSTTRGEGYGRPLAEFAAVKKPVLATNWSGQLDFLTNDKFLFDYTLKEVEEFNIWKDVIEKDSKWAHVVESDVINKLSAVYFNYDGMKDEFIETVSNNIITNFNINKMNTRFVEIVEAMIPVIDVDLTAINKKLQSLKNFKKR